MKNHTQLQPASLAQCMGAAQAEAERMHGGGATPNWRAGAFDWRPWAVAGVALSAVAACAAALLWPWEAPAVADGEGKAVAVAPAAAPQRAAAAVATSSAALGDVPIGAFIASPFAGPMGAPLDSSGGASLGRPDARPGAPGAARLSGESATSSGCGNDCATASVAAWPSDPSALLPTARLVAAVPTDLDAWALDPQPYAVPAATPLGFTRPLFNRPAIPNESDPTPGEETSTDSARRQVE